LLADATAGDPIRGTKWARKSLRTLVKELRRQRYTLGRETVRRLLQTLGYSLRSNRKADHKRETPDRDRQMRYLARQRRRFLQTKRPAISVDAKKKELIGPFKNSGRTWRRVAYDVLATDFSVDADGRAIPYGVYDLARNRGFVGVGTTHETGKFAVSVIRRWWQLEGRAAYPDQTELLIQADSGGSNGYQNWAWKWELQHLADETGLTITVTHYPTSASKWNWIEHRLFCHISANWAGEPLVSHETVLKFIRTTKTKQGLRCRAYLDRTDYEINCKITRQQQRTIQLQPHRVLPHWNYTISPHTPST
jgi:hypothetical protein